MSLGQAEGTPAIVMHLLCAGCQVGTLHVSAHSDLTALLRQGASMPFYVMRTTKIMVTLNIVICEVPIMCQAVCLDG